MADTVLILSQFLVYALILFAAYLLFRQIRKLLRGETGCNNCSSDGCLSKSCCVQKVETISKDDLKK